MEDAEIKGGKPTTLAEATAATNDGPDADAALRARSREPRPSYVDVRRAALAGCVAFVKPQELRGLARDKVALAYFQGAHDAAMAAGYDLTGPMEAVNAGGYLEVLEQLAD